VPKISPERIFRSHFPRATIERQKRATATAPYFLVRKDRDAHMWTGCDETPAKAWADACERAGLVALKAPEPAAAPAVYTSERVAEELGLTAYTVKVEREIRHHAEVEVMARDAEHAKELAAAAYDGPQGSGCWVEGSTIDETIEVARRE
jgi:hypothetical protein